ncbi:HAMP domain-containing protein [Ktedonosporobacter rubrisoli]|uniref:histidine kinase n=1 Tax=Ktedonosporobacter rubrisoli TaxID=2509675 RepID=A0A4P6JRT0_KTERU|nr:ATP-binding protein [Ktedonosporobacter rubrisoli]QBD78197.1 HAMP domain-containing protein [Ktedonosporobacter rubrisoli]
MNRVVHFCITWLQRWHLSLFEKVILVNSLMLIGEALAGLWVTSHNLETHHYLIDTSFIIFATLLTLLSNVLLLKVSFRPLFSLLATIREVSAGQTHARAPGTLADSDISELAGAFNTMLDRLEAARRQQTALILQAQEEEQRRIALELHDETGQNLTAMLIHTEVLNQSLQGLPEQAIAETARKQLAEGLQQLSGLTEQTLENIRVLAQQLRPSVLDDLGLQAAFRWLVEDGQQRLHLDIDLRVESLEEILPTLTPIYETTLFRIAQESLTNIVRHAQTNKASITLTRKQNYISLEIQDNGCGYDLDHHRPGLGIFGMRERAAFLGGKLTVHTQPGQGTIIQALLPLPSTSQSVCKERTYGS